MVYKFQCAIYIYIRIKKSTHYLTCTSVFHSHNITQEEVFQNPSVISSMLNFTVEVGAPELIRPEKLTPREFKYLSNIDDQTGLRNHIPFVHFLPPNTAMHNNDPVVMIKQALSKVLVFYYPVAGRLQKADKDKLVVDCCGEGVIFRGGNADITLTELCNVDDDGLKPPFPKWDKLLVDDIWGNNIITDSPLLRMQVLNNDHIFNTY